MTASSLQDIYRYTTVVKTPSVQGTVLVGRSLHKNVFYRFKMLPSQTNLQNCFQKQATATMNIIHGGGCLPLAYCILPARGVQGFNTQPTEYNAYWWQLNLQAATIPDRLIVPKSIISLSIHGSNSPGPC